jgi:hypothetical protein
MNDEIEIKSLTLENIELPSEDPSDSEDTQ